MRTRVHSLIVLILAATLAPAAARPCTTFCLKTKDGGVFYGRNFDFPTGLGQVHINPRGLKKTSLVNPPEKPLTWVSKYGSISFNQNGREFPYGGMNEAGLVIEQMWNNDGTYPASDSRSGLGELQWIQYQLDMSASVADVLASDRLVRISNTSLAPLHFLIADARGHAATLEYVDGKTVVHAGKDLPYPVLANNSYDVSLDFRSSRETGDPKAFDDATRESSGRFARAAAMIEADKGASEGAIDRAFAILAAVTGTNTQWSIVYDLGKRTIIYKTRNNKNLRRVEMDRFDFSCSQNWLCVDIEDNVRGSADFKPYTDEGNAKLIDNVWDSAEFLKGIPAKIRAAFAGYPATVRCAKD
jgi:penicillin V acylase-like amidase (Ntn superfamily)